MIFRTEMNFQDEIPIYPIRRENSYRMQDKLAQFEVIVTKETSRQNWNWNTIKLKLINLCLPDWMKLVLRPEKTSTVYERETEAIAI